MGKRELLIVLGFVVAGVIAFQVAAPPAKTGEGFSFARLFSNARRDMRREIAHATVTIPGTVAVGPSITDIRLSTITQTVQVIGEPREDIAYEFVVTSTGPDVETAKEYAKRSVLKPDHQGSTLALRGVYPEEGSQSSRLVMHVPSRLNVSFDDRTTGVRTSGIRGVRLGNGSGDVNIQDVTGPVTGSCKAGNLTITGAPSVTVSIVSVTATIERVAEQISVTARGSHVRVSDSPATIEIDETNTDVAVSGKTGAIRINGSGGTVTLDEPTSEVTVEVRRTEVEVTSSHAVPMTIVTTDEALRFIVGAGAAASIDAAATDGGRIQSADFGTSSAQPGGDEVHWSRVIGPANAPKVVLRNQRDDIVIRKAK